MSKEKTLRTLEETEVMQATGVPAQETEGVGVVMATEIITDLKKQLEEAKEEAKDWEENWKVAIDQREISRTKIDIINLVLRFRDYKCLKMALSFVKAAYNQQPPEEEEEQEVEE
jgi:hypothetical protein